MATVEVPWMRLGSVSSEMSSGRMRPIVSSVTARANDAAMMLSTHGARIVRSFSASARSVSITGPPPAGSLLVV